MASIKYVLQGKSDNASIFLRLSISKSISLKRKTGLSINPRNWNSTKGFPKQSNSNHKTLVSDLRKLKVHILDCVNNANSKGTVITGNWLNFQINLFFNRVSESNQSEYVVDAIKNIIDNARTRKNSKGGIGLSKSRVNSYKSLLNIFSDYQKKDKYKVRDINPVFAQDFLKHLLKTKKYSENYALKKIADLKTVCLDAESYGIKTHSQLKSISGARPNNENIIYLTPTELNKIESTYLSKEALRNARKWLLLGCDIGQRGGDLLKIDKTNFINRNGYSTIELKQQKTNKHVTIPVLETTRKILEDGLPYRISIQKFNNHIKEICLIAEINEKIY